MTRATLRRALPAARVCTRFAAAFTAGIGDLVVSFHEDDADSDSQQHGREGVPAAGPGGGRARRHHRGRPWSGGGGGGCGAPPLVATSAVHRYLQRAGRLAAVLPKLPALRRLAIAFDADDPVVCTHNEEAPTAVGGRGGGRGWAGGGATAAADGCASWVKPLVVFQLLSAAAAAAAGPAGAAGGGGAGKGGRRGGGRLRAFTLVGAPLGLSLLPLVGARPLEVLSVGAIGDGTGGGRDDGSSDDSSDGDSDDGGSNSSGDDGLDGSSDGSDRGDSSSSGGGDERRRRRRQPAAAATPPLSPHAALRRVFGSLAPSLRTLHLQAPFFGSLSWGVAGAALRHGWAAAVPPLPALRTLILSGVGLSVADVRVLARPCGGVTTLRLVDCWDAPSRRGAADRGGGAAAAAAGVPFPRLTTLDVGGCHFSTVTLLGALLSRPAPLADVALPDLALAALPHLPSVLGGPPPSGRPPAKLTFPPGTRGDTLVATLRGGLPGVAHLVLRLSSLSAAAAAAVGALPSLATLDVAVRTSARLDSAVAAALCPPALATLTLRAAFAAGAAGAHGRGLAARSPALTEVVWDGVWGEGAGEGVAALAAAPRLRRLTLRGGDVTRGDPGVAALREKRPDVRVWFG